MGGSTKNELPYNRTITQLPKVMLGINVTLPYSSFSAYSILQGTHLFSLVHTSTDPFTVLLTENNLSFLSSFYYYYLKPENVSIALLVG